MITEIDVTARRDPFGKRPGHSKFLVVRVGMDAHGTAGDELFLHGNLLLVDVGFQRLGQRPGKDSLALRGHVVRVDELRGADAFDLRKIEQRDRL